MDLKRCIAVYLGRLEYRRALELQLELVRLRGSGLAGDVLMFLEHPPTITLGRNGRWQHLLVERERLAARGVAAFEVDRGGDITFHGPGQLVGYPILELTGAERDVRRYMRSLEEVLIRALARHGVASRREPGVTGVWTERGKIAALGVHISRWVTRHGFALNVAPDLGFFDLIVPCGIAGSRVASMASLVTAPPPLETVAGTVAAEFGSVLERDMVWMTEPEFRGSLALAAQPSAVA
jgi:lipoate-protein ligase B